MFEQTAYANYKPDLKADYEAQGYRCMAPFGTLGELLILADDSNRDHDDARYAVYSADGHIFQDEELTKAAQNAREEGYIVPPTWLIGVQKIPGSQSSQ